jgi:Helix-loop-helix DNA-binding domain
MPSCCARYKFYRVIECSLTNNFALFYYICRLKREEGGGSIIIQAMSQPQQLQQQNMQMNDRPMDHDEKKMRRQIANSNERRRMQSINAGFQSLRQLLPHHEGEKLSKVSRPQMIYNFLWGIITMREPASPCSVSFSLCRLERNESISVIMKRNQQMNNVALKLNLINLQFPCTQLAMYDIRTLSTSPRRISREL